MNRYNMELDRITVPESAVDSLMERAAALRKKAGWLRPVAAAACLALMAALPVGAAVKNFIVQYYEDEELPENLPEEFVQGFVMENPYHIPSETISEDVFRYMATLDADSTFEDRHLYFDSMGAVEAFIGLNLFDNPVLDEAEPGVGYRTDENGNRTTEYYCKLYLEGLLRGNPWEDLSGMTVRTSYHLDSVHIGMDVRISTREWGDVMGYYNSTPTQNNADIPSYEPMEKQATASGKEYTIAYGRYPKHELWCAKVFYLSNGAGIVMDFSGYDEATLRATVRQVMDGFQ